MFSPESEAFIISKPRLLQHNVRQKKKESPHHKLMVITQKSLTPIYCQSLLTFSPVKFEPQKNVKSNYYL